MLAVRKVHPSKVVQRSDDRWIVMCEDRKKIRLSPTPAGINDPVQPFTAAERA